jgi:ClpP class serine protease
VTTGFLALAPQAFGMEFEVSGGVPSAPFEEDSGVAVIRISGPLEQHPHFCWQDYETLHAQAEAAFKSHCKAVALCINSPGGAASGCFELARAMRAMSEEYRKPLGVFVDGQAASAAYAIACAATPGFLYAPQTATVASLAVYETMMEQTALDAAMGVSYLIVPSSGADLKLTGHPHVKRTDEMVQHTQAQVDLLTDYFYGLVESMRGVRQEEIRALRGAGLLAQQGLDKGLVDVVSDWAGFLAQLETAKGTSTMGAQAKAKTPFEDALSALAEAAQDGDEETAKKAKKMLAAHYAEDDGADKDEPKDDSKPEPSGASEEDDKKAESEEKPKAQALAPSTSNELTLAEQVHALRAEIDQQKEATARAALLAKRPDFSNEVRNTLAMSPMAVLEAAVKNWPRVNVSPMASANADTPGAVPGRTDNALPGIRADQQALLDRMGKKGAQASQARIEGSTLVLENMTPEAAAKRLSEMVQQGLAPQGVPHDFARISNTTFKVKGQ